MSFEDENQPETLPSNPRSEKRFKTADSFVSIATCHRFDGDVCQVLLHPHPLHSLSPSFRCYQKLCDELTLLGPRTSSRNIAGPRQRKGGHILPRPAKATGESQDFLGQTEIFHQKFSAALVLV